MHCFRNTYLCVVRGHIYTPPLVCCVDFFSYSLNARHHPIDIDYEFHSFSRPLSTYIIQHKIHDEYLKEPHRRAERVPYACPLIVSFINIISHIWWWCWLSRTATREYWSVCASAELRTCFNLIVDSFSSSGALNIFLLLLLLNFYFSFLAVLFAITLTAYYLITRTLFNK